MSRSAVDSAFAVAFILIVVVLVYPTTYMFLYVLLGPRPPMDPADAQLLLEEQNQDITIQRDVTLFLGFNWAWFAAGAIFPIALAYMAHYLATRIFREAHPRALKLAAFLSVWLLYGAVTLFAWLRAYA